MTTDQLRTLYLGYVDLAMKREFDRLDEFVHDEVIQNGVRGSRAEMAAALRAHTTAIPDLVWEIQDLVIAGNRIAAHLLDTGTPTQEWFGLPPTGRSVTFHEMAFYEVRDGRIAATWYMMDVDAVRRQLGG